MGQQTRDSVPIRNGGLDGATERAMGSRDGTQEPPAALRESRRLDPHRRGPEEARLRPTTYPLPAAARRGSPRRQDPSPPRARTCRTQTSENQPPNQSAPTPTPRTRVSKNTRHTPRPVNPADISTE